MDLDDFLKEWQTQQMTIIRDPLGPLAAPPATVLMVDDETGLIVRVRNPKVARACGHLGAVEV